MAFNPEQDGWRLSEAIMRLSDPEAWPSSRITARWQRRRMVGQGCHLGGLKILAQQRPAQRWMLGLRPPHLSQRLAIEWAFADRLTSGEIVGWARRDSPMAPYERVPADAWPHLCRPPKALGLARRHDTRRGDTLPRRITAGEQGRSPPRQRGGSPSTSSGRPREPAAGARDVLCRASTARGSSHRTASGG